MDALIDNLFINFLSGFGFGLVLSFGAYAFGTVFHLAWHIMKK